MSASLFGWDGEYLGEAPSWLRMPTKGQRYFVLINYVEITPVAAMTPHRVEMEYRRISFVVRERPDGSMKLRLASVEDQAAYEELKKRQETW